MKNIKNEILYLLIFILFFSFGSSVSAQEFCSSNGYTVITINGMTATLQDAKDNKVAIEDKLPPSYNNQPITVNYIHNETHLAGIGDFLDASVQKLFEKEVVQSYDLTNMLNDLSLKVKTQKVLFVAHSQGNFYANNIYNKFIENEGGTPKESMGIYGIASPASYVAGGGKYITSSNDGIINLIRKSVSFLDILKPNVTINSPINEDNLWGHSLSKVYLEYEGDRIASELIYSLSKLQNNNQQNFNEPCISPQKLTLAHQIMKVTYAVADPTATVVKYGFVGAYDAGKYIANKVDNVSLAVAGIFKKLLASAGGSSSDPIPEITAPEELPPLELPTEPEVLPTEELPPAQNPEPVLPQEEVLIQTEENPQPPTPIFYGGGGGGAPSIPTSETDPEPDPVPIVETEPEEVILEIPKEPELDTTAPIISIIGNSDEFIVKDSVYVDAGATALDDIDGELSVITTGEVDTSILGSYVITYTATDTAGNISTKIRNVNISNYLYIPKYKFGSDNGDGNDWQVWAFNGSYVYDWTDTYVDNYLHEQFKIKNKNDNNWCSQCLQRGIFNHDPQKGFELTDVTISNLEENPQNRMDGITYDVVIQWDSTGYTYTISHDGIVEKTGHTDIANMNNDLWVGWGGTHNNFKTFPTGTWIGTFPDSPLDRKGGIDMALQPFPVYNNQDTLINPKISLPNEGAYTLGGMNPTRGRSNLTPFSFQIIYTDENNNEPQNVKLHVSEISSGITFPEVEMQKKIQNSEFLSDGNFTNGEAYTADNIIYELAGDYNYYFTASDSSGNLIRFPENETLSFGVVPSTYTYIPKYKFGSDNGDGNDWQVWAFNGSYVYDWTDTYVNYYLKEEFKILTSSNTWCSQCLQRGIFNHDPQKGFEASDVITSNLEENPQNRMDSKVYSIVIQWDSTGYTYTISSDGIVEKTDHTNISNVSENLWVGWDGSYNNFKTFPSGDWVGLLPLFLEGNNGGGANMIMQPYQVYNLSQIPDSPPTPILGCMDPAFDNYNEIATEDANPTLCANEPDPIIPICTETQTLIDNVCIDSSPTPDPDPIPPTLDTAPPFITSYTLNGVNEDITINPLVNPLNIILNSSEDVNWMSVKIENQDDSTFYKIFYSGSGCVDGGSTCAKIWDGVLTHGGLLQNGIYKIKVHIKDSAENEFYDYLPSIITISI